MFDFRSSFNYQRYQRVHVTVEQFLISDILPHCADDQLNSVLTTLVERRLWRVVGVVLEKKGVSDSKKQWAVGQACEQATNNDFRTDNKYWCFVTASGQELYSPTEGYLRGHILPHCADDQLDSVLKTLVERRLWSSVLYVLERGFRESSKRWVLLEVCACCKSVDTQDIPSEIYHFCADDQADCVLTTLVERRQWRAVGEMLKKGVNDSNKQWAVQEACKHSNELESLIQNILPHCADDQLDSVLTSLVKRYLWQAVGVMLNKKGVSDSNKQWAVQEACEHSYESESLIQNILPHCADDQLDSVLKTLVERRLWHAVLYVLERGVSESSERWVVLEVCACCESVDTQDILSHIFHFCADDQVDCVLTTLVERCQWRAVGEMLKKGVNDSNKQRAVQEACKHCKGYECEALTQTILPHCADDQLDSVLTTLVERRLWQAVGVILKKKGVSDSNKQWAVGQACEQATNNDFRTDNTYWRFRSKSDHELYSPTEQCLVDEILPHCADNQLESVLTTLLGRRLWKPVGKLLQRGISETQRKLAVKKASKNAADHEFVQYILPLCSDQFLDSVLSNLVKRRMWKSVGKLLQQGVDKTQCRRAVDEASKAAESDEFCMYVLPYYSNQHLRIVQYLVENGLWDYVQQILHCTAKHFLCQLVKQEGHTIKDDSGVGAIPNNCHLNVAHAVKLFGVAKKETASKVHELHTILGLKEDLCDLLYTSYIHQVCFDLFREEKTAIKTDSTCCLVLNIYLEIISCIQTISTNSVKDMVDYVKSDACKVTTLVSQLGKLSSSSVPLCYPFLKQFSLYYTCRQANADDEVLLMMFAVLPLVPELQSVALRIMLRHKRWDVISQADLSGVWEQDRRHLLQAAVKQRQWSVVKRWADHTLYDDQRVWALNEALNEKQWGVALLLADHGLTDIDLMRVHYRLAKYADWDVILHMFERGADVAEVKERLGRMKDNKKIPENVLRCIDDRCSRVRNLEKEIQLAKADGFKTAWHCCSWIFVFFTLTRNPGKKSVHCALKVAMKKKAWHVVMQLVRLGMDASKRHSLFARMMKRRQWGVCRVLLEQGLSVQLCLKVLPELMDMNQWALVARVMEHEVGDDVRQQVMQRAWERREGSVVWLCIKSLPTPLSVEEREARFQRAFSCELWQVIKPLVEVKDETGIRHRDTVLLEAIDQHEWDLVDHCQRHHADINMKDDDGHTPLHRVAMKKDWEAVKELVVRDADPNLLDRERNTVLHRAIAAKQWSIVKLLIEYQADIHMVKAIDAKVSGISKCWLILSRDVNAQENADIQEGETPLGMLIDARRVDIIDHSLLWCPDQSKGVNAIRETALHAACLSGCYDSMYNLVARGVNPRAVTKKGQSVLVYAVLNEDCPQKMVAECIRLGYSKHQPELTNIEDDLKPLILTYRLYRNVCFPNQGVTSPFLCALLRGLPVVMQMLYESGACSQRELFRLYTELPGLADPNTDEGRKLQEQEGHDVVAYQNFVYCIEDIALPYLTEIATTPRSLVSTCRLVISHCLTLSKTRHRDVDQLPLTERMKNFVLFSDLTDPDFGKDTT